MEKEVNLNDISSFIEKELDYRNPVHIVMMPFKNNVCCKDINVETHAQLLRAVEKFPDAVCRVIDFRILTREEKLQFMEYYMYASLHNDRYYRFTNNPNYLEQEDMLKALDNLRCYTATLYFDNK